MSEINGTIALPVNKAFADKAKPRTPQPNRKIGAALTAMVREDILFVPTRKIAQSNRRNISPAHQRLTK
jgi:hypothetical protein